MILLVLFYWLTNYFLKKLTHRLFTCTTGQIFTLEYFCDINVILKVKSVSEKTSKFKVQVNDTLRVFYAIFPFINSSYSLETFSETYMCEPWYFRSNGNWDIYIYLKKKIVSEDFKSFLLNFINDFVSYRWISNWYGSLI